MSPELTAAVFEYLDANTLIINGVCYTMDEQPIEAIVLRFNEVISNQEADRTMIHWLRARIGEEMGIRLADRSEIWLRGNDYHRMDGPALIYTNTRREFYLFGKNYTEKNFDVEVKRLKKKNK